MPTFTDDYEAKVTLEAGGAPLPDEMPFRLLLLGDWSGRESRPALSEPKFGDRKPLFIDRDNFEDVMRKVGVELDIDLNGDGRDVLRLRFAELDDFHPDRIFHQISLFSELRRTRKNLSDPQTFNETARQVRQWLGADDEEKPAAEETNLNLIVENQAPEAENLLDHILSGATGDVPTRMRAQPTASRELNDLLGDLVRPYLVHTDETEQAKLIAAVDEATGELMRQILHHPRFQALESAWRGAYLVVSRVESDADLKIYLLDAVKAELTDDLKSVGSLTESVFYKLLSEKTAGSRVDESWAAVCADYTFSPDVDDTATLMRIAEIAADSETPFIACAGPQILGLGSIAEAADGTAEWRLRENTAEAKLWAMLRGLPEAASLGLGITRFIARMPYGAQSDPTETFSFEELDAVPEHDQYLWANPAFACALLLAQSFTHSGWQIGQRFSQEIDNLPLHVYRENGENKIKPCAEISLTLNGAEKILEHGLMPLLSFRDSDKIRLARFQSIASESLRGKWTS